MELNRVTDSYDHAARPVTITVSYTDLEERGKLICVIVHSRSISIRLALLIDSVEAICTL
jgi:hypothetical protein